MAHRPWQDKETLEREYIRKDKTQSDLADMWGCSQAVVSKWIRKHGLTKFSPDVWQTEDGLHELYVEDRLSIREIAERFGVSSSSVRYWLVNHGIERRDNNEAQRATMLAKPPVLNVGSDGYEVFRSMCDRVSKQVYHHRLLAVSECGIDAVKDNVVHHKNGIKWDNRPENLEIMNQSEHAAQHADETDGYIGRNLELVE